MGGQTLSAERGLFLEETWRLHPSVCAFTSELYYENRLTSRAELAQQRVDGPAPFRDVGLRFVPVDHSGNSSGSPEEVEVVATLVEDLLARRPVWVNQEGEEIGLGLEDLLIVSPYNAQVALLRAALPAGARVVTVDKFQGQEAPVVIYSTATSSAQDAPRGMEFLFSPNRLNVATLRARCLAVQHGTINSGGGPGGVVQTQSVPLRADAPGPPLSCVNHEEFAF